MRRPAGGAAGRFGCQNAVGEGLRPASRSADGVIGKKLGDGRKASGEDVEHG